MGATSAHPVDVRRLRLRVGLALVVGAVLWVAFAKFLVPSVLAAAYRGVGPSLLTDFLAGWGKP